MSNYIKEKLYPLHDKYYIMLCEFIKEEYPKYTKIETPDKLLVKFIDSLVDEDRFEFSINAQESYIADLILKRKDDLITDFFTNFAKK